MTDVLNGQIVPALSGTESLPMVVLVAIFCLGFWLRFGSGKGV